MQIQGSNALIQGLNKLNQAQVQMADKVQNFNNKMLKASVADQVQTKVQESKTNSFNALA